MLFNRQPWWFGVISLLLIWATKSVAQPTSKPLSELDRLRIWHPIYKPANSDFSVNYYPQRDEYAYENVDQLIKLSKEGQKIEALLINAEAWKQGRLANLNQLKAVRVLNLNGLTAGQTDSLFQIIQDWSLLERLIVWGDQLAGNKAEVARLTTGPDKI